LADESSGAEVLFSEFRHGDDDTQQGRTSVSRAAAVPQSAICAIRATVLSGEARQTTDDFVLVALKHLEFTGALHAFCIVAFWVGTKMMLDR